MSAFLGLTGIGVPSVAQVTVTVACASDVAPPEEPRPETDKPAPQRRKGKARSARPTKTAKRSTKATKRKKRKKR